jgi:ribosomal protein L14E/L6E/L27E
MFEEKKAKYLLEKIRKYAGDAVEATMGFENGKWVVIVNIKDDNFSLNFKDVEIRFRRCDGSV